MTIPQEIERKFWKALGSDRVMMLGVDGAEDGHVRPMTAQFENDHGPLWFFTSKENAMVDLLGTNARATATFSSKGHDVFASVKGTLRVDNDRAVIDRLWNNFVSAWFEGGKGDPKLTLLRLDPTGAEVWLGGSSVIAGIKLMLGANPEREFKDKVAQVDLR